MERLIYEDLFVGLDIYDKETDSVYKITNIADIHNIEAENKNGKILICLCDFCDNDNIYRVEK